MAENSALETSNYLTELEYTLSLAGSDHGRLTRKLSNLALAHAEFQAQWRDENMRPKIEETVRIFYANPRAAVGGLAVAEYIALGQDHLTEDRGLIRARLRLQRAELWLKHHVVRDALRDGIAI